MTHEPECPVYDGPCCPWMGDCHCQCCCDALRACEQRVRNEVFDGHHRYYQQVRDEALNAASAAVFDSARCHDCMNEDALNAIDALRGES